MNNCVTESVGHGPGDIKTAHGLGQDKLLWMVERCCRANVRRKNEGIKKAQTADSRRKARLAGTKVLKKGGTAQDRFRKKRRRLCLHKSPCHHHLVGGR